MNISNKMNSKVGPNEEIKSPHSMEGIFYILVNSYQLFIL